MIIKNSETVTLLNKYLRSKYDLWIVDNEQGWHEFMSIDFFKTPWGAFLYAVEYGNSINSGIRSINNVLVEGDDPTRC